MPKSNIPLTPCTSSNLAAHGYDPVTRTLAVRFKNGDVSHYADVPQETYDAMKGADSVGSFLHHNIKGKFEHTPMRDEEEVGSDEGNSED